jgi:peptidyl-prolyl cis-trans isomerase C
MNQNRKDRFSNVQTAVLLAAALVFLPQLAPAEGEDGDAPKVIAEYQGTQFTEADLVDAVARLNSRARRTLSDNEDRMRQFVENHIVSQLIFEEGRKKNFDQDPEIRQQIAELERHLVVQRVMQEQQAAPVEDADVKAYYDANQAEFSSDRVHAAHILVAEEDLAREVHEKLKKDSSQFAELAKEHSVDRSNSQRGGDLGFFGKGRMVKEFEEAAFALTEDGQISDPIQTRFGWHIIQRVAREDGSVKPFEEVQNQIKVRLVSEKRRERTQAFLDALKNDAGLVIHDEALAGIELPAADEKDDKEAAPIGH